MSDRTAKLITSLEELIQGVREPNCLHEELFMKSYTLALTDTPLFEIIGNTAEVDELTEMEMFCFTIGYALGQYQMLNIELQLIDDKDIKFH